MIERAHPLMGKAVSSAIQFPHGWRRRLRRCDRGGRRSEGLSSGIELRLGAADSNQLLLWFEAE
jgi:hypothetical protein